MIFKTAYDTTACAGYEKQVVAIKDALQVAAISGILQRLETHTIYTVASQNGGGMAVVNQIPSFNHPLVMTGEELNQQGDKAPYVIVDLRPYTRPTTTFGESKIINEIDHQLVMNRAKYNSVWVSQPVDRLRDISSIPMSLFASWISESVGRRFALDPREQTELMIACGIYYYSLFTNETTMHHNDYVRIAQGIARSLNVSAESVVEQLDKRSIYPSLDVFCKNMEAVTGCIRLRDMNVALLFTILAGTFYMPNSKEIIAVALEHPPTWLMIVNAALTERTYRSSQIAKIGERPQFKRHAQNFGYALMKLIEP